MKRIGPLDGKERELLTKIRKLLSRTRHIASKKITSLDKGLNALSELRKEVYEELNQLQHAALILASARWPEKEVLHGSSAEWQWHPHQTGGINEPDLRCKHGAGVIVAEATASDSPQGLLDARMAATLKKLHYMKGQRYYFVRTEAMRRRAETKITKAGWRIQVVMLSHSRTGPEGVLIDKANVTNQKPRAAG